jgi:Transposase IS116/IS110/IS902 family
LSAIRLADQRAGDRPDARYVILLETGPIDRFADVGNFASYARCVDSVHTSNRKKKGEGNVKNGNKYLAWAFVEAANFAKRFCPEAKRFHERKKARTGPGEPSAVTQLRKVGRQRERDRCRRKRKASTVHVRCHRSSEMLLLAPISRGRGRSRRENLFDGKGRRTYFGSEAIHETVR